MDEFLTIDEIEARYAPDWVLIGDPQTGRNLPDVILPALLR